MSKNNNIKTDRAIIESYIPIADYIAAVCGPRYEIVLHDLTDFDHTIIYIANSVTGRKIGDSLLTLSLDVVLNHDNTNNQSFVANIYRSSYINGKKWRLSDFYIRNNANEVIGLFSINVDVTPFEHLKNLAVEEMNLESKKTRSNINTNNNEEKVIPLTDMMEGAFNDAMNELSLSDSQVLSVDDKIRIIAALNNKNLFIMKGTVALVAEKINVSVSTVYRYLHIVKRMWE